MPRTPDYTVTELKSRAKRNSLPSQPRPYFCHLRDGLSMGYRRGKLAGSWTARMYDATGKPREHRLGKANDADEAIGMSFQQAADAAQAWFKRQITLDAGEVEQRDRTVGEALDRYLVHLTNTRSSDPASTRTSIEAHIRPRFGSLSLTRLRHSQLVSWRDALASSPARVRSKTTDKPVHRVAVEGDEDAMRRRRATVNRVLTVLKAALNYAHEELRWTDSKAAWEAVKPYRNVDTPKVRFLTGTEVTKLVDACPTNFRKLVQAALVTGMRYGELTRLKAEEVNLKDGSVYVSKSKNGESRDVHLRDEGIALFRELIGGLGPKESVFTKAEGAVWGKSEQKRPMDAACLAAQVEGVTFHILRHTYASHSLMGGMPLEVLQKQLGHNDLRITMRHYAHLCNSFKRDAVRRTGPVFGFEKSGPVLVRSAS